MNAGRLTVATLLAGLKLAAQPSIQIESLGDSQWQLSWPEGPPSFGLEQAASLEFPISWQPVPGNPTVINARRVVRFSPTERRQFFRLRAEPTTPSSVTVESTSPADHETGVAVTRETLVRLSGPLSPLATVDTESFHAAFGGRRLLARPEFSDDRRTLTLFYLEYLPADALVTVTLDGSSLIDPQGNPLDADGDGQPAGVRQWAFHTASVSGLPGTGVVGHVFASEPNPDGSDHPLANVIVTVDGAEETLRTYTDDSGAFTLLPAPAGRFFVHVDGRTAAGSQWPGGAYYPFVGKAWDAVAGNPDNLASGTGVVFLPLIPAQALQAVSATEPTVITFSPGLLGLHPELAGIEMTVPPNALLSDSGARGGRVGLAAVPPDRLPEPLPPGLNLPVVITIQTDGPQNFDRPVPVRFPNLPDPVTGEVLGPGEKTMLWSFNHDIGRWEPQGTATISADGRFADSDPGVGVRQPGWHGVAPGIPIAGPPRAPRPDECYPDDCPPCVQTVFCEVPGKEGEHYAICALKCLGDVLKDIFGKGTKPKRTAFETGLRCVGGPDKCPEKPEDSLSKERRDCMDRCRFPDPGRRVFVVPCEGFANPCVEPSSLSLQALHAPAENLLPDRFEEQLRFWEVEGEFLTQLTGTPKIVENVQADVPKVTALFDALADRVRADSPAGIHLSPEERAELVTLPRPQQFTQLDWESMIDRLDALQGAEPPPGLASAEQALEDLVTLLEQRGWNHRLDGLVHGFLRLSRSRAPAFGGDDFPARAYFYSLEHHQSGLIQRGRLNRAGAFEGLVLAPEGLYTVVYFDPQTRDVGAAFFQAPRVGAQGFVPTATLAPLPAEEPDTDGDHLPDLIEEILGTDPLVVDTDGDGLSDEQETRADSNPLDGQPPSLGVVARRDTPGTALDVFAWNDLAAVADGNSGVALFDVSNPVSPTQLAQVDTPGRAVGVVGEGTRLAVADEAEGVTLMDVSSPSAPRLVYQSQLEAAVRAVALIDDRVVAGLLSGRLVLLDDAGQIVAQTNPDPIPVEDLLKSDQVLYVLRSGKVHAWSLVGGVFTPLGQADSPRSVGASNRRLRLSGDSAHLLATHPQGYDLFDFSAFESPALLRQVTTSQFGWRHFVNDGAGLGLAAAGPNSTDDGPHDVSLYAIGPSATGTNFIATLTTPGGASAVCVYRGFVLVADGTAGLTVLRHHNRDSDGLAPAVSLRVRGGSGGAAVEMGAPLQFTARATDDQLVSHVEFYVDDQLAARDGSYPFQVELRTPPTLSTFKVRALAVDTAGNATWSDVVTVDPSRDMTAPSVVRRTPGPADHPRSDQPVEVSAAFNEPIDRTTLESGFRLFSAGPDALPDTSDDAAIPVTLVERGDHSYALALSQPLPLGTYFARLTTSVSDWAGNTLPSPVTWLFVVRAPLEYVAASDQNWDANPASAVNWSSGSLPTLDDTVLIGTADARTVRVAQQVAAFELVASTPLEFLANSQLRIGHQAEFHGVIALSGATWMGGFYLLRGETTMESFVRFTDVDLANEGHWVLGPSATLGLANTFGHPTTLLNRPGGTLEMVESQIALVSLSSGPTDLSNEGLLISRGSGRTTIGSSRFLNSGSVAVREGTLEIRAGSAVAGPSQHLGSYRVDQDASLLFTGLGEFGRASRISGAGNVTLSNARFPGSYEIDGATTISGEVEFTGPVRSRGAWTMPGAHAVFSGLSPELSGPVVVDGAMTVRVQPQMQLRTLEVYRDLTIDTALEVQDTLRLDSTITPGGTIASARLLGTGRLRANGELVFAGTVNSAARGSLEIAGTATCEPGTIVQFNPTGYALAVLAGGTFDVSQANRVTPRGPLVNEGTLLKNKATLTLLTVPLLNRGIVRVQEGTLQLQNGYLEQTAGTLELLGGGLVTAAAPGFAADTTIRILGGSLTGAGTITCGSLTNSGTLSPGSPLGVLELKVGTHPEFSVYQQTSAGTLVVDIQSSDPDAGYDRVEVSGRALLAGTLELKPSATFNDPVGTELVILTSLAREGTFDRIEGETLPGNRRFEVVYGDQEIRLRVVDAN